MLPPDLTPIQVSFGWDPVNPIMSGAFVELRVFRQAVLRAALPLSGDADIWWLLDGEAEVLGYAE